MVDARLLKTQEVQIVELIRKKGFNPKDFTFLPVESRTVIEVTSNEKVVYKKGDYYFHFTGGGQLIYSPGKNFLVEGTNFTNWISATAYIDEWLNNLEQEVEIINNWDSIIEGPNEFVNISLVSNKKFLNSELQAIHDKLEETHTKLIEMEDFNQETRNIIDDNFEYIKEASQRLGRKDWTMLLIGCIMNIAQLLTNPENIRQLLHYAKEIIGLFNQTLNVLDKIV